LACRSSTGSTLISYVQNLRIEDAKRLLEGEEKLFEDIALGVGYENRVFFRRLFKRRTGLTPGQYRADVSSHRSCAEGPLYP
jgi:AraC-like DNA-binding protein